MQIFEFSQIDKKVKYVKIKLIPKFEIWLHFFFEKFEPKSWHFDFNALLHLSAVLLFGIIDLCIVKQ